MNQYESIIETGEAGAFGPNSGLFASSGSNSLINFVGSQIPKTKSQHASLRGRAAPLSQMIEEDNLNEMIKARKRAENASIERRDKQYKTFIEVRNQ